MDTIRDNIHRVEELTAVLDRQTQRLLVVSYLLLLLAGLLSLATIAVTSIFPTENAHPLINERLLVNLAIIFLVFFAFGFGFILVTALGRRRLFVQQLQFATMRLAEIVKVASQTQEHLDLDRLESMTLQFHLREAEGALAFADRVLPRSAKNDQFSGAL